jgi:hypothetical protein
MAAAARPYWTGFLKLSLVTIAVRLYSPTSARRSPRKRRGGARKLPESAPWGRVIPGRGLSPRAPGAVAE